jgi:hypothetical protein
MEVHELRVGNNIKIDGIVVTIDERTIFDFNHDKRVKEPIPLTEDILLKCGFEQPFRKDFFIKSIYGNFEDGYYIFVNPNGSGIATSKDNIEISRNEIKIQYLHQLQNLYFALTNQELTITL